MSKQQRRISIANAPPKVLASDYAQLAGTAANALSIAANLLEVVSTKIRRRESFSAEELAGLVTAISHYRIQASGLGAFAAQYKVTP